MIDEGLKALTEDSALPDRAINTDEIPWVPQGERVWFKPLRFDLATGRWINLLKVQGSGRVNRHRHTLVVDGGVDETQTLFILEGTVQYLDEVFSKLERYTRFCEERNIEPVDLRF